MKLERNKGEKILSERKENLKWKKEMRTQKTKRRKEKS
jgi:hypothetical protein